VLRAWAAFEVLELWASVAAEVLAGPVSAAAEVLVGPVSAAAEVLVGPVSAAMCRALVLVSAVAAGAACLVSAETYPAVGGGWLVSVAVCQVSAERCLVVAVALGVLSPASVAAERRELSAWAAVFRS
jgi:hypothetical protein